ncbi:acyltransferase [Bombilactobacillus bombi]|uniref:acyltransferase n=1 Tax=Bombilactobacillus bombi TaxID=1303590 RepID=UPI0015E5C9EE|nr:acyltransferase [Bombilactobacillus bombi]MBA1434282.1 acyltransferase [Bombilactobacillus bombi]
MKTHNRYIFLDLIRIIAMALVVMAHSFVDSNQQPHNILAHTVIYFTDLAVPLFFMISGAVILNSKKTFDLKYLFKIRLPRILIPFIMWEIISAVGLKYLSNQSWHHALGTLIYIYHTPVLTAFWFIYPLVLFYLLSPFIKAALDHLPHVIIGYLLGLWYLLDVVFKNLSLYLSAPWKTIFTVFPQGQFNWFTGYFGYFILGYLCLKLNNQKSSAVFTIGGFTGAVILVNLLSPWLQNNYVDIINLVINLILPFFVVAVFLTLKAQENHLNKQPVKVRLIEHFAALSYGVYLCHGMVILSLNKFWPQLQDFGLFVLAFVITVAVVQIINLLPPLRKILS